MVLNNVTKFHRERVMFYIWNGKVNIAPKNDSRSHKEWINDSYIYYECIRGYYYNKFVIYTKGDDFAPIKPSLKEIVSIYLKYISDVLEITDQVIEVHNGVIKGVPGEIWLPKTISFIVRHKKNEMSSEKNIKNSQTKVKSLW